jgi:hypothetical protein
MYGRTDGRTDEWTDGQNECPYVMRCEGFAPFGADAQKAKYLDMHKIFMMTTTKIGRDWEGVCYYTMHQFCQWPFFMG